jgi:hypothetical protein
VIVAERLGWSASLDRGIDDGFTIATIPKGARSLIRIAGDAA